MADDRPEDMDADPHPSDVFPKDTVLEEALKQVRELEAKNLVLEKENRQLEAAQENVSTTISKLRTRARRSKRFAKFTTALSLLVVAGLGIYIAADGGEAELEALYDQRENRQVVLKTEPEKPQQENQGLLKKFEEHKQSKRLEGAEAEIARLIKEKETLQQNLAKNHESHIQNHRQEVEKYQQELKTLQEYNRIHSEKQEKYRLLIADLTNEYNQEKIEEFLKPKEEEVPPTQDASPAVNQENSQPPPGLTLGTYWAIGGIALVAAVVFYAFALLCATMHWAGAFVLFGVLCLGSFLISVLFSFGLTFVLLIVFCGIIVD